MIWMIEMPASMVQMMVVALVELIAVMKAD